MPGKDVIGAPPIGRAAISNWAAVFIVVFLSVFLLVVFCATIYTFILPEAFASTARVKVERDWVVPPVPASRPAVLTGVYDPYLIQTEFEIIRSEIILDEVIDRLDLNTVWGKKFNTPTKLRTSESREFLKHMIELHPARNTSLIDIKVYRDDRAEAANVANMIADVYQGYRRRQSESQLANSLVKYNELKDELKSDLANKTNDPKIVDAKITQTIARAAQLQVAMDTGIPGTQVEIIERANPGVRPVRPNKPLNIALGIVIGGIAGFVVAGGVVMLGIAYRKPRSATPVQSLA